MTIDKDDPRLGAYALGEMPEEEARAFEAELEKSPEAQAEVEMLREMAGLLRDGLKKGPETLSRNQRAAIEEEANGRKNEKSALRRRLATGFVVAASFTVIAAMSLDMVFPRIGGQGSPAAERAERQRQLQEKLLEEYRQSEDLQNQIAQNEPKAAPPLLGNAGRGLNAPQSPTRGERDEYGFNTESYAAFEDNPFIQVATDPRSTFSIDVDTASYANVRSHLSRGQRPPRGAVRIEELINYFPYSDPAPNDGSPFAVRTEVSEAPWAPSHRLVRIALKGREIPAAERASSNLVFLIDVSGSMDEPNKLPLLKRAMRLLVKQLYASDRVSIVVYAGASGLVLPPTSGADQQTILDALDKLQSGGSTNGGQGIELAYATAARGFLRGGINRVILATDGDFNVGVTDRSQLVDLIKKEAKTGVFLSVLGFGRGNFKDDTLESLAQHGNGNYAYIDGPSEARKVLVQQATGTLITIAKDVKIQVEFNPRAARAFRLIGYENRILAHRDFNDDKKDAGEIGAGHTVTALYEIVPPGAPMPDEKVDALKYQRPATETDAAAMGELLTVKLRHQPPQGGASRLIEVPVRDEGRAFASASVDFRFAASVAAFGMILRESPHKGEATMAEVVRIAESSLGEDPGGYRREFVALARSATSLPAPGAKPPPRKEGGRCPPNDPLCADL
ncbi:vWA domain-containing protein [Polyangium aurulentum]|uniref:vWA domain-containing protein n=1 Tax=Polyangium aurulentum TaxID=2567896 RepID=UPI001980E2FC|nr:VWA domain-containing protein [Polyangium aurulentum]UQA60125.1 VWA domain-containing protein [Polyangium aurulentum]